MLACQVRVTVGDSSLSCCVCVTHSAVKQVNTVCLFSANKQSTKREWVYIDQRLSKSTFIKIQMRVYNQNLPKNRFASTLAESVVDTFFSLFLPSVTT